MIRLRPMNIAIDWAWFTERNPIKRVEDTCGVVSFNTQTYEKLACCVFDSFSCSGVNVHVVIDNPICLRHGFIEKVAEYVYDVCALNHMLGLVPANNAKAIRLNKRIGFKKIAVIPNGYADGIDYIVMQMTKEQCKFYGEKVKNHGWKKRTESA